MTFMYCSSQCLLCDQVFSYNPDQVPSIRAKRINNRWVADATGSREPICKSCIAKVNEDRAKIGNRPFDVLAEAYEAQEVL